MPIPEYLMIDNEDNYFASFEVIQNEYGNIILYYIQDDIECLYQMDYPYIS